MSRSDRVLADAEAVLRRHGERRRSLSARARQRRNAALMRKLKYAVWAVIAVLAASVVAGFVMPLGTSGVMIALGVMLAALLVIAILPMERTVRTEALQQTPLGALPLQTEIWLENQRKALPAPAATLVDSIGVKLEALAPQLERLGDREPAAQEVRKLLADHLPELVTGYQSIPQSLRREERNGRVPEQQLVEGLGVIDAELARMSETLASGDLDRLAVQNRFLEMKYQEAKELGH
ncbi:hypothetical protein L288_06225 [Sphingobium quisquiliarum P25]|uniref:5-bromo-4-chloroindolyl phosphate hydrolysis protein n=1 Tax=Sphingobium quisquiliarum P25 TaxID=1329909 RepID=T0IHW4_9SPHN|nr:MULTISPECIES: hypothetical protein [Sphingobium]EQB09234.1 hypothetical protein L288_06225 [Sphingobium quisquiliarum P25]